MDRNRWERIQVLFHEAANRPAGERLAFLKDASGGDEGLAADVMARAIVRAAPTDPFAPERWWTSTNDSLDVVREVLGLLNAWAGLPVRHSQ